MKKKSRTLIHTEHDTFAVNRAARKYCKAANIKHTAVPMVPWRNVGKDKNGKTVYQVGEEQVLATYLKPKTETRRKGILRALKEKIAA